MGLKTEQIVKILQLKLLGRKTALKICEKAKNETIDNDIDLQDFILGCIANKWVQRLPEYSKTEFSKAFQQGESILDKSERAKVKVLSIYDNDFPECLKGIHDKPIILNFRGNYKELNTHDGIAIIGTREPTDEGVVSGKFFGKYFGEHGYNVVSGLAKGCDSAAHRGCLDGRGMTTAIVAHGLHTIYPKENEKLAAEIVEKGGVLLSEYFIGVGALANYFVERDRLQAGLSKATIVIQTAIKGGTMHAVNATLESKKPLAVVKYNVPIYSDKVSGNEMLIRNGAIELTRDSIAKFLKQLSESLGHKVITEPELNQLTEPEHDILNEPDLNLLTEPELDKHSDPDINQLIEPEDEVYKEPEDEVFIEPKDEVFIEPKDNLIMETETVVHESKTPAKAIGKRKKHNKNKDKGIDNLKLL